MERAPGRGLSGRAMDAFKPFLVTLSSGAALSREQAREAFDTLLSGEVTPAQAGAFLMGLRVRGETIEEISGAIDALRARMLRVEAPDDAIDIVGTGGDHSGSYNVSTLAGILTAACGVPVAKHGNRAATSLSGAADVLTALGVKVGIAPEAISACIREAGIGFMFAPAHHASMRHVAPVRVEIGTRTIFNMIGPLTNPAGVRRQVVGLFSAQWIDPIAEVLKALGSARAWVVHGADGLDELSTTGPSQVAELRDGTIRRFTVEPAEAGLPIATLADIKGGDAAHNAAALRAVLNGEHTAYRDIAVFNAAAALVVADRASSLKDGAEQAGAAIADGRASAVLDRLIAVSNR